MSGNTIHNNNVKSVYGTGSDAQVYHDGSNFYANNTTGQLNIDQSAVTESIVFKVSNANALDTTALIINREGDLITGKDVTIAGDLTVNGTTTTVNSQTLSVDDPLISLAINNAANSLDIGYYGKYNDGTTRYLGLFNDASDSNKFKLFRGTTVEPTTTVNIGGSGYVAADLELANLISTGTISGVLANGVTATTQTGSDASTKVATTAYVDTQAGLYLPLTGGTLTGSLTGTDSVFDYVNVTAGSAALNGVLFGSTLSSVRKGNGGTNLQMINSANVSIIIDSDNSATGEYFNIMKGTGDSSTATEIFKVDLSGNATFAGDVTLTGTGDKILDIYRDGGSGHSIRLHSEGVSWIDNNNNFGIGTNSPDTKLHIADSTSPIFTFERLDTTTTANEVIGQFNFKSTDSTDTGVNASIKVIKQDLSVATVPMAITFETGVSGTVNERMRIDSSGNVGIGTTSPENLLHVQQKGLFTGIHNTAGIRIKSDGASASGNYHGTIALSKGTGSVAISAVQESTDSDVMGMAFFTHPSVTGGDASVEKMRIDSSGNVGIGTDSPSELLHLKSGAGASADIGLEESGIGWRLRNDQAENDFILSSVTGTFDTFVTRFVVKQDGDAAFGGDVKIDNTNAILNFGANSASINNSLVGRAGANNFHVSGSNEGDLTIRPEGSKDIVLGTTTSVAAAGTERLRIKANGESTFTGNVGIGTDSPDAKLDIESSSSTMLRVSATSDVLGEVGGIEFSQAGTRNASIRVNRTIASGRKMDMRFYTGSNSEAMRIDSIGKVTIGDISTANTGKFGYTSGVGSYKGAMELFHSTSNVSGSGFVNFYRNSSVIGSIGQVGTTGVSYNTSSDYRLKEDLKDFNGLEMVSNISVYNYKWKVDDTRSFGVMAHELQEVLPDAVSGEKDAEEMQGVDYSKIVPLLIKSIQELTAKVERLEAK